MKILNAFQTFYPGVVDTYVEYTVQNLDWMLAKIEKWKNFANTNVDKNYTYFSGHLKVIKTSDVIKHQLFPKLMETQDGTRTWCIPATGDVVSVDGKTIDSDLYLNAITDNIIVIKSMLSFGHMTFSDTIQYLSQFGDMMSICVDAMNKFSFIMHDEFIECIDHILNEYGYFIANNSRLITMFESRIDTMYGPPISINEYTASDQIHYHNLRIQRDMVKKTQEVLDKKAKELANQDVVPCDWKTQKKLKERLEGTIGLTPKIPLTKCPPVPIDVKLDKLTLNESLHVPFIKLTPPAIPLDQKPTERSLLGEIQRINSEKAASIEKATITENTTPTVNAVEFSKPLNQKQLRKLRQQEKHHSSIEPATK
jgi:hypothetical protein